MSGKMSRKGEIFNAEKQRRREAEKVRLGEVCEINMGQSPQSGTYNSLANGLPFYQGNADFGEINPTPRVWCSAPVKIAEAGDILVSVRAPIGALNFANERCCIGRGLASLRVNIGNDAQYMYYALKSKVDDLNARGTGSTFKAITKSELGNTCIPVFSLPEQKRIAATLDRICELKKNAEVRLAKLDLLVKSRFVEMFGDPTTNIKGWDTVRLSELGELNRGVSKARPRNSPDLLGGPYPLVQTGEVSNSGLYIRCYNATYSEKGLAQSRLWKRGTLCITIAANIAQTAILTFDACFPDSVVGFVANGRTNTIFIHFWFSFFQRILEAQAPQVAQKNINLKILSELNVIVPPLALQREFAAFVEKVEKLKEGARRSAERLDVLYRSKLQEYFGEADNR